MTASAVPQRYCRQRIQSTRTTHRSQPAQQINYREHGRWVPPATNQVVFVNAWEILERAKGGEGVIKEGLGVVVKANVGERYKGESRQCGKDLADFLPREMIEEVAGPWKWTIEGDY